MSIATGAPDPPAGSGKFFVNFNQDCTSLAVGNHEGYRLYSLSNLDQLELIYSNLLEDTCIVERLFSSSLVAVVNTTTPRKLKVCHFKKGTEICNYSYANTILGVRLNRSRLVVCLEESLYVHNIRDMKVLHTIRETPPNRKGLCALSSNSDHSYLAYPGSSTSGEVQIFDVDTLHAKTMIFAHDSALAGLTFSPSGQRLATASEKGTVIRVFSVLDGTKLIELQRGIYRNVVISALAFSTCGNYLASSSCTETVHVFNLVEPNKFAYVDEQGLMGMMASYMPSLVGKFCRRVKSMVDAHLTVSDVKSSIGVTVIQNQLRLLVATDQGVLYVYNIDPNTPEISLKVQHLLNGKSPDGIDTENVTVDHTGSTILGSYAGVLKGYPVGQMSGTGLYMETNPTLGGDWDIVRTHRHCRKCRSDSSCAAFKYNMTDSEKFREMAAATEIPPKGGFQFNDDQEYPPLTQKGD